MINPDKAVQAFKEKFSKMSYEEREQYLKEKGFSFGNESERSELALIPEQRRIIRQVLVPDGAVKDRG